MRTDPAVAIDAAGEFLGTFLFPFYRVRNRVASACWIDNGSGKHLRSEIGE
jgi:hypothetical protein